jgi:phosphoribosylaminoimidazole-succinocarboxamide synthase
MLKSSITENATWKTIRIENILIRDGKIEIGLVANGAANAFCYVDDVSLVKTK